MVRTAVAGMVLEHRVGDDTVGQELNRAVVVAQLLLGDAVRMVAVHLTVDAGNLLDDACDGSDVVRNHHNRHAAVQLMEHVVELLFELVVDEVGRLVEYQQPRVGDDGPAEQRPLHLSARDFANRVVRHLTDARSLEQRKGLGPVFARVAGAEAAASLEPREGRFDHRNGERTVEVRELRHVANQPLLAVEELRSQRDGAAIGYRAENRLDQRGFAASVGADDADEVVVGDVEVDVAERLVAVVADAHVAHGDKVHGRAVIWSVISAMFARTSSRSGSMATLVALRSRAMISTADAGNWLW